MSVLVMVLTAGAPRAARPIVPLPQRDAHRWPDLTLRRNVRQPLLAELFSESRTGSEPTPVGRFFTAENFSVGGSDDED